MIQDFKHSGLALLELTSRVPLPQQVQYCSAKAEIAKFEVEFGLICCLTDLGLT